MKLNGRTCIVIAAMIGVVGHGALLAQPAPVPEAKTGATAPPVPISSLPTEAFAKLPFIDEATISPNGRRIAGLLAVGGQTRISIYSLFDQAEKQVQIAVPEGTQAGWINWVNDDNIIVGLTALLPIEADRWYISRIIGINRLTGKITKLLWDSAGQNAADVVWYPSDGSTEILVSAQYTIYSDYPGFWPTVYRVDVAKGSKREVVVGRTGVIDWNADAQGNVRTGLYFADGGRKFSIVYRAEGSKGFFRTIDVANTKKEETLWHPRLFLPGTDNAIALHNNDKGKAAIYEVDLLTRKDIRTVYTAPGDAEVLSTILSEDRTTLLGARLSGADRPIHWFDNNLAALQDQISKAVGDRRVRIISLSNDRKKMLVSIARADTPGSLYYYDVDVGALQKLSDMNPALGSRRLSPVKLIHYSARDGTPIEAVLTLPAGRVSTNLPVIMLPHGGPWAQDYLRYDYWSQFLASRGYAVLQPNFRGSTGYGDQFEKKGQGQMGLAMQDDITDGLRWAISEKIADPKRACIIGASYGGYAAMWGIAKDPDLYKCAISIAGVSTLRREVNDMGDSLFGKKYKDDWTKMTPDFAAVSPLNAVAQITAPLMLIHGKKDITVDHNQSVSMNNRMRDAGKNVEFVSLPQADHYFTREDDRIILLKSIETFLEKHNPADNHNSK
jgi:dipeptidyl aminopeptidase/acylaminoacyl peptidase